jgi:hypothetical protein
MTDPPKKYRALYGVGSGVYILLLWLVAYSLSLNLTAYNVSLWIWLGILAVTLHLAWAGTAAIAPAMVWLLTLMWIATVTHTLPKLIPHAIAQVWAASLLEVWIRGGLLILLLAFARPCLKPLRLSQVRSFGLILGLTWSALGTGVRLNSFFFTQPPELRSPVASALKQQRTRGLSRS